LHTLVTGASGHIGGNLVRALLKEGRKVRMLVHKDRAALENLQCDAVQGDILDPDFMDRAVSGVDTVFHAAALISIQTFDRKTVRTVNINGTRNVVNACLRNKVKKLIHYSSIHAFDPEPLDGIVDEERGIRRGNGDASYDLSKAEGEREIKKGCERGLNAVIVSPTAVVGPHDYRPSLAGSFLIKLCQGKLPAILRAGFNWVDVRDVVSGSLAVEKKAEAGSKYIFSGTWASHREIAQIAESVTGIEVPKLTLPLWVARVAAPIICGYSMLVGHRQLCTSSAIKTLGEYRYISCEKAKKELGYTVRPFSETMKDTFFWYRNAGKFGDVNNFDNAS